MTDLTNSFQATTLSIQNFFGNSNYGYFIPNYQRKYSWGIGNVDQLMVDICYGVDALLLNSTASHFMGTVILIETKPDDLGQKCPSSVSPEKVRKVIDGQQRISTIALLACQIYRRLHLVKQNLPSGSDYSELFAAINEWQKQFEKIFSFDLFTGSPTRKPVIIRGESDCWVAIDPSQSSYKSEVAEYISKYISAINENRVQPNFPKIPQSEPLGHNLGAIEEWLDKVENAHRPNSNNGDYSPAWLILEKIPQGKLWDYERPGIVSHITQRSNPIAQVEGQLCSIVQYLAFCYYLLNCCGFTVILPKTEDRAFDMFQSLNATGTPLTAIETFKPLVTYAAETLPYGYTGSDLEEYYDHVDSLFNHATSSAEKTTLTNEFLTAFSLIYNGYKLPSQFSSQRMWLTKTFSSCKNISEKTEFTRRMGDLAVYWKDVLQFDPKMQKTLPLTENVDDNKEAALCILYLKAAGHTMSNSVLGRFYGQAIRKKSNAEIEFVQACKAIAAFFTLWRSALPNTGLDDAYRKLLSSQMSWEHGDSNVTISNLKNYLLQSLTQKGIGDKNDWMVKARQDLRYDIVKTVCKFALFVVAHDTEADTQYPGLIKIAVNKTYPQLLPDLWNDPDFKSIEHVAPQKRDPNSSWDYNIYLNGDEQRVGNLILLPTEINSTVGSKPWVEKWIYYQYLAETDIQKQQALQQMATANGFTLSQKKAITLMEKSGNQKHIQPIVQIGQNGNWDCAFIEQRTERICDILWTRMINWLQ